MDCTDRLLMLIAAVFIVAGVWSWPSTAQTPTPTPAQYQGPYGGPPMWDRRRDRGDEMRIWPRRTPWGPQMEDCIMRGDCRGPRYREWPEGEPLPRGWPPTRERWL